ncbi:hypothetical protein [Penaeicola halotolerans]|uniref:hypothetical protein n=1 Tax=Penaeicola halotolerans TaxID=2793196 RepID=UPI001CF8EBB3|nr:hypothetical protein [Penaeicola halotolerans]
MMKKMVMFLLLSYSFMNTGYAQKYFGKSFQSTVEVDEYYDASDVKISHSIMGKAEMDQGFRSLEKCQQKIVDLAKKKGADGIIFTVVEENYGSSTSSGANVNTKKKNKTTATGSSSTVELTKKKILATFIKYD